MEHTYWMLGGIVVNIVFNVSKLAKRDPTLFGSETVFAIDSAFWVCMLVWWFAK